MRSLSLLRRLSGSLKMVYVVLTSGTSLADSLSGGGIRRQESLADVMAQESTSIDIRQLFFYQN